MDIPQRIGNLLMTRQTQIALYEVVLPLVGLVPFSQMVADAQVSIFIDNDAASSNLIRGHGHKDLGDMNVIIAATWLVMNSVRVDSQIHRTPSQQNPSDQPARFKYDLAIQQRWIEIDFAWAEFKGTKLRYNDDSMDSIECTIGLTKSFNPAATEQFGIVVREIVVDLCRDRTSLFWDEVTR